MQLFSKTGVTSVDGFILETSSQKLVVCYKPAAAGADGLAEFKAVKFEAQIQTPTGGTRPLVYPTKLSDLMEIAAANQGFVKRLSDGTFKGTVELSNVGALDLGKDQISLSFMNLAVGATLKVNNLDSQHLTKCYIEYSPQNFQADAPKEVDVREFYQLCLPKAITTKVELKYPNGRNISLTPDELEAICDEINEMAMLTQSVEGDGFIVKPGATDFYCISVAEALTAKVSLSATGNCFFVRNSVLN